MIIDLSPDVTIIQGDCRDHLAEIHDVDAVITDPPYHTTDISWDQESSPFDWGSLVGCVKSNGYLVVFSTFETQAEIAKIWKVRYPGVWLKSLPLRRNYNAKKPKGAFELYVVYAHPEHKVSDLIWNNVTYSSTPYRRIGKASEYKRGGKDQLDRQGKGGWAKGGFINDNDGFRYHTDVLSGNPKCCMKHNDRTGHPTQKPVEVLSVQIQWLTNPGGLVFDPFMGSGSTGVACIRTGRKFIGIEKDSEYFSMARERLDRELRQERMAI